MSFNTPAKKGKSSINEAPSTTPNVPPPSWLTQKSTTPAGNPPESSRIFGSSFANNTFGYRYAPPKGGFTVPESSPPAGDEEEEEEDADAEGEEHYGAMDIGELDRAAKSPVKSALLSSIGHSPRGLKRSRTGQPREARGGEMAGIARSMVSAVPSAPITESDDFVLHTEEIMSTLGQSIRQAPDRMDEIAASAAAQLSRLWLQQGKSKTKEGGIGPVTEDPLIEATYLASLLMQTHIPHTTRQSQPAPVARSNRSLAQPRQSQSSTAVPLPRALLDWLNAHHNPFPDDFNATHMYHPSPAASDTFWDIVLAELVRGNLTQATRLLRDAGWENAVSAQDDGSAVAGYRGMQLEYTEEVVDRCISIIELCPAIREHNWHVKGTDWQLFRRRVRNALQELDTLAKETAEADDMDDLAGSRNVFAKSNMSLSASTMRANSRIPWTVYENLVHVYRILLGDEAILQVVQDWLEAAILMTVWWDGEDSNGAVPTQSLRQNRRGLNGAGTREVDVAPSLAYRRRLRDCFVIARDEVEDFDIDTLDPIQVGLACILEDDIVGVAGIVRTMSPTVTATIVDLADVCGWLPRSTKSRGLLQQEGFSSEDLMVLSHGPNQQKAKADEFDHDEVLSSYADMLAERDMFETTNGSEQREGWEIAASVLGRLDDKAAAQVRIADIFDQMEFEEAARVDKVLELCADMGLDEQARGIAEVSRPHITGNTILAFSTNDLQKRYADSLASPSASQEQLRYGPALIYYARAHASSKLKSTLSLLTSLSLLHSSALPPRFDMDDTLESLLSKQRTALVDLAHHDTEAATLLASSISGYATVRRYYELRDQDVFPPDHRSSKKLLLPLERTRAAANALIAAIESASDCIRGGLFDPDVGSAAALPVDGLLALLGETLPLMGQGKRIFNETQVWSLLRVVEDLDTVSGRVNEGCERLVVAAMNAYRGGSAGGKATRSKSNLSASLSGSSWDVLASQSSFGNAGAGNRGDLEVKRAWDWRKGIDAVVVDTEVTSHDVLLLLRTALAREVARGWSGALNW